MLTSEHAETRASAASALAAGLRGALAAGVGLGDLNAEPESMLKTAVSGIASAASPDAARTAACRVAAAVGALGPKALVDHGVVDAIGAAMRSSGKGNAREAGALAVGCLCSVLGVAFEPHALGLMERLIQATMTMNYLTHSPI